MINVDAKFKMLDQLADLKEKEIELLIELNETNAKLACTPKYRKIRTYEGKFSNSRTELVNKKCQIENGRIRIKQEISLLSKEIKHF